MLKPMVVNHALEHTKLTAVSVSRSKESRDLNINFLSEPPRATAIVLHICLLYTLYLE